MGPVRIYTDAIAAGTNWDRPGLFACLAALRDGDTLVVKKLDRVARSVLSDVASEVEKRVQRLFIVGSAYDHSVSTGELPFIILTMAAEFQADLIRQCTAIAKGRGRLRAKQLKLSTT